MQPPADARRVSVAPERLARWLGGFAERHGGSSAEIGAEVVGLTGADGDRAWVEVPFPPLAGGTLDDLVAHAECERRVGVLLVRRGGWSAGVFDGGRLVASKTGSSYVQGTTKAGGQSQQRFARRRANQAAAAFARAADDAAGVLAGAELAALYAGGDREAVATVLADRRLSHLRPTGAWLEVKDPKQRVLAATPQQFRTVRISLVP